MSNRKKLRPTKAQQKRAKARFVQARKDSNPMWKLYYWLDKYLGLERK